MSTVRTIAKNTTVLAVAQVASYLLGFFYMVNTARSLGAAGFGIISFAAAITSIFGPLADLGVSSLMIREIARDKSTARRYLAQMTLMKMLLAVATFAAIALTVFIGDYPWQTVLVVYLLAISLVVSSFTAMLCSVFNASENMEYPALGQFLNAALMFIGVMLAVRYHVSVVGFAFLYVYASVGVLIYSLAVLRWRFASSAPPLASISKPNFAFWKDTVRHAWPFAFVAIFMTISYSTDSVMLSFMKGDEAVGSYNAAYRPVSTLSVIPIVYLASLFPVMSRMYVSSSSSLRFMERKSFQYLLTMAVPIGIGTTVLAERIIWVIYGAGYGDSGPVLQVLVWSMVFSFPAYVLSNVLYSTNRQMAGAKIMAVCAVLNVALNAILIPKYSGIGAAIATVATQVSVLTLSGISCARAGYGISLPSLLALLARTAIASAAMWVFVLRFDSLILWALIPLAALLYFAVLFLVRGIGTKEDLELVRAVVRRQPRQT
jgi:O-antigen/teichoic acid export membrane protein